MKMKDLLPKRHSLKFRIALLIGGSLGVMLLFLTGYSAYNAFQHAKKFAHEQLHMASRSVAADVAGQINQANKVIQTTASTLAAFYEKRDEHKVSRETEMDVLKQILHNNENVVGNYLFWKPAAWKGHEDEYKGNEGVASDGMLAPYFSLDEDGNVVTEAIENAFTDPDYIEGMEKQEESLQSIILTPYLYPVQGEEIWVITLETPVIVGKDEVKGFTGVDFKIGFIQTLLSDYNEKTFDGKAQISLIASSGEYIAHSHHAGWTGKSLETLFPGTYEQQLGEIKKARDRIFQQSDSLHIHRPVKFAEGVNALWQLRISLPSDEVVAGARGEMWRLIGIGALLIGIGIILLLLMLHRVVQPVLMLSQTARKLSHGRLNTQIRVQRRDEIGDLANAFRKMIDEIRKVVDTIQLSANEVRTGSGQVAASAQQIAQSANEQASSAEEVSSSMEEMKSSIAQNAEHAKVTEKIAGKAEKGIEEGFKANEHTVDSMHKIASQVETINEIVEKIDMLAVNAAIEAARAGEAGKGFSVVAHEVRELSEMSRKAAGRIDDLTGQSVKVAEKSAALLHDIVPDVQKTSQLVKEITASSEEQDSNAQQVLEALEQLNSTIQQNSASAEALATSAEELKNQGEGLKTATQFFKLSEQDDDLWTRKLDLINRLVGQIKSVSTVDELENLDEVADDVGQAPGPQPEKHERAPRPDKTKGASLDLGNPPEQDDTDFEKF